MLTNIITIVAKFALVATSLTLCIITVRTIMFSYPPTPPKPCLTPDQDFIQLSEERLANFQTALRFKTVSKSRGHFNGSELTRLRKFIVSSYPHLHSTAEWEIVNNYSLLYHIKGSNPDLRPYLLISHLDVVPVTNRAAWHVPPFSGQVMNGFIYGRGAIDVKHTLMGILEATEYILSKRIQPVRSFYIAFGHDEEVRGNDGAAHLATRLRQKGVTQLEYISDEGLPITEGIYIGGTKPVASVGCTEKGYALLNLTVDGPTGHSSLPPKESTIGILANAIARLEATPHPSQLGQGLETAMFEALAPEMTLSQRIIVANLWIFRPLMPWFWSDNPVIDSTIKTVTAVTMFNAGVKTNVLPPHAEAVVNHRIHPSQTVAQVVAHDHDVIADSRVNIEVTTGVEAHPTAGHGDTDFGFQVMKTTISQIWPDSVVVPGILPANTDTRHYLTFTNNSYRFSPNYMYPGDPVRFHGVNERISVKNYEQVLNFYYRLIRNSDCDFSDQHFNQTSEKHQEL